MSTLPRVRFAPSPTGYLHIGGARTALFNWLWARKTGGTFLLRIEDTDRQRSTQQAVEAIFEGMRWLGLDWDEGPGKPGLGGPYFQMERLEIYRSHADKLISEGKAYACYCTKEELDADRARFKAAHPKDEYRYPGTCRDKAYEPGKPHVIRFRMPREGTTSWDDLVKGTITIRHDTLRDEVILRGDGVPLYNFGVVVDDLTMKMTLVARGDDHVINTTPQILMYQALGAPVPQFAHLPMILGADGARLSKRHGATSVIEYREMGFMPQALVNYLVRFGWSHGDQEIFTLDELVKYFDWAQVGATAGTFNPEKLLWVNHQWLRALSDEDLALGTLPHLQKAGLAAADDQKLRLIVKQYRERAKNFAEIVQQSRYFYAPITLDPKAAQKFLSPDSKPLLQAIRDGLAGLPSPDGPQLEQLFNDVATGRGLGLGKVAQPVRVALTGGTASPGIHDVVLILGKPETLARLDAAIAGIP